ncbi:MAG: LysR family transcriptional regulator [Pseudomonadota bacterium]
MSTLKTLNERVVIFEAVMRTGSLSGAARDLKLSQPTVRRAIAAFEQDLATSLFTRSDNGLIPTETARSLHPSAKAVVETSFAFYRAASAATDSIAGTVRVSASRVVSHFVLPGMIATLRDRHPEVEIEIVPDDQATDLLRRDADIAIRHVAPKQLQLVARKLRPIEIGLFARQPGPCRAIDLCLQTEPFVWEDRSTMLSDAAEALGLARPARVAAATDDQALQVALVAAGVGMGLCQVGIARAFGLHRVDPGWSADLPVWIVAHEDQVNRSPVRQVFDLLVALFSE